MPPKRPSRTKPADDAIDPALGAGGATDPALGAGDATDPFKMLAATIEKSAAEGQMHLDAKMQAMSKEFNGRLDDAAKTSEKYINSLTSVQKQQGMKMQHLSKRQDKSEKRHEQHDKALRLLGESVFGPNGMKQIGNGTTGNMLAICNSSGTATGNAVSMAKFGNTGFPVATYGNAGYGMPMAKFGNAGNAGNAVSMGNVSNVHHRGASSSGAFGNARARGASSSGSLEFTADQWEAVYKDRAEREQDRQRAEQEAEQEAQQRVQQAQQWSMFNGILDTMARGVKAGSRAHAKANTKANTKPRVPRARRICNGGAAAGAQEARNKDDSGSDVALESEDEFDSEVEESEGASDVPDSDDDANVRAAKRTRKR